MRQRSVTGAARARPADAPTALRRRIELTLANASDTASQALLSRLWRDLALSRPAHREGAAILIEEAESYAGDLEYVAARCLLSPMAGHLGRIAGRVRTGSHTRADLTALSAFSDSAAEACGSAHPYVTCLRNAVAFLSRAPEAA